MANAIRPEHLSLIELLTTRLFTIPDYQRSYSWTGRQRKDLFEDIMEVWQENADSHFMATVVCRLVGRVTLGTDELTKLDIVDGQQRLTTLIILLNAIRYALAEGDGGQHEADSLRALLVKPHGDDLLLLQTNHDTSHFFENYMRSGAVTDPADAETLADKNLLSAVADCRSFVEEWPTGGRTLQSLLALVKNKLTFILHEIQDEKTVYTVFEVLNSRGLPVSYLDRLKSMLMGLAFKLRDAETRKRLVQDLHRTWRDIYATLGLRQALSTEALRFAATLYMPASQSKVLSEPDSVDKLCGKADNAQKIRSVAEWLLKVTQACDAVKSDRRQDAVTRIAQARLLAVALHTSGFEAKSKRDLLAIWERVSFRIYGLHDKDGRWGVGKYVGLAWEVAKGRVSAKDVGARLLEIGSEYPVGKAISDLRKRDCYTDWQDDLRYLLFRYEEHLARELGKPVDNVHWTAVWSENASLSIEHILPQSKAPEDTKHTLGNLMLLPPKRNTKLGDKLPHEKVASYRETGFYHAGEVADMLVDSSWTKVAMRNRQEKILDWVSHEWAEGTDGDDAAVVADLDLAQEQIMESEWTKQKLLTAIVEEMQLVRNRKRVTRGSRWYKDLANRQKRTIVRTLAKDHPQQLVDWWWPDE